MNDLKCDCGQPAKYKCQTTDKFFGIFYQYLRCEEHQEWGPMGMLSSYRREEMQRLAAIAKR